jgi:hypothetical protein
LPLTTCFEKNIPEIIGLTKRNFAAATRFGAVNTEKRIETGETRVADLLLTANKLATVFGKQLEIYKKLTKLTSSLSADIARTKGNMNGLTAKFEQENELLIEIENLKNGANSDIEFWLKEKQNANFVEAKKLDEIIKNVQEEIARFLEAEKILKKQIDFYRTKDVSN